MKKRSRCGHFSVCLWLMETERVCSPRVHWDSICVPEFPWICSTPWGVSSNGWWVIPWYRHYITVSLPARCSLIIHKTHTQSSEPMVQHHITHIYSTRTSHTHTPQINNYYPNCVAVICDIYVYFFRKAFMMARGRSRLCSNQTIINPSWHMSWVICNKSA